MTGNASNRREPAVLDAEMRRAARLEARRFLAEETEFHLGGLPTEQPHPKTRTLAETAIRSTSEGVAMLLSVDHDLSTKAGEVFEGAVFASLVEAMSARAARGGRVAFSGCGATGRLAIILEKMWRVFWDAAAEADAPRADRWCRVRDAVYSIMTGGDRALIRSVENFEDFQGFGRRQVVDAGLGKGDLLVAITEGGETSSVIGTAWEAAERGADVFFVYNNPTGVLREKVKRSREIIEDNRFVKVDLATGPMALSGSTRLQATTMELLVVGAAMEVACRRVLSSAVEDRLASDLFPAALAPQEYAVAFEQLVTGLTGDPGRAGLAGLVDLETDLYRAGGLVTYVCDDFLLDIISDTTERTPTFMLPPFRPAGDTTSPVSWAFAKDPLRSTEEAWLHMLGREPRGLIWNADDYRAMGGLPRMVAAPPKLDLEEIRSYRIGRERDASRFVGAPSALVLVSVEHPPAPPVLDYLARTAGDYAGAAELAIGVPGSRPAHPSVRGFRRLDVSVELPATPMHLFAHLAVKLVLNTVSTATMAKLGRIRGNWMIQLDATNKKLIDRATRIIADLAGITYEEACEELHITLLARTAGRYRDSAVVETLKRFL